MKKLGLSNHAELIRYALQRDLLPIENLELEKVDDLNKENT